MISPATISKAVTLARSLRTIVESLADQNSEVNAESEDIQKIRDGADALARVISKAIK